MRSTINILVTITALLLILPIFTTAQPAVGCCCDPILKRGSFTTAAECAALGFNFTGPPPSLSITCDQHCEAILIPEAPAQCGDNICQATETASTCPGDCAPIVSGCGSPAYKPPAEQFTITPVKNTKALILSFTVPCPSDYITVQRCPGTDCTNFTTIAEIPPTTVFTDEDSQLEFNKDYNYQIKAHYTIAGEGEPATAIGNAGDIECWQQKKETFCLNDFSYDQYLEYLTKFGYARNSAAIFQAAFDRTVDLTFSTRFNKAWQCNDINLLAEPSPQTTCDSKQNEYCISDENGARCARREPCGPGFDPFGLYAIQDACEATGFLPRYCFFDKSITTPDKCYSCDPRMTCYDYKGKNACERDNCGAGDCQWRQVFEDIGTGVCVDTRYNNCELCDKKGTPDIENSNATSDIWDACREEKSTALSTTAYPCFYDKDRKRSKTCDEATCADYTELQCGSPEGGIKLNPDNKIIKKSTDTCSIGVCHHTRETGCIKNADGNIGAGFQDCAYGNKTCEQDYFPPITTLIPTGLAGRVDLINIRIFDKTSRATAPVNYAGKPGYRTYLCVKNETNTCADSRAFNIAVNTAQLVLKNTALKLANKTLAKLDTGNNTITFYSRDAANNLEILRDMNIFACEKCSGPTLLNFTVTGGRIIGKTIYTSAKRPTFTFTFDEQTIVTYADITRPETGTISLTQQTPGAHEIHSFIPIADLQGTYNFTINGHNDQNIYFDPALSFTLIADPDLADVNITPADGSILNKTLVDIELNFSKPVTLNNITLSLETFEDPYIKKETKRDITALFKTTNNRTYTAKADKISGGKNTIIVDALGYNALNIYKESSFFVSITKPGIRLTKPDFGVTAYSIFNTSIETQLSAKCAYVFDAPTAPSSTDFEFFKQMEGTGTMHTSSGLSINYGDPNAHPLHVYCNFEDYGFGIIQRTFNLTLDPDPPIIKKSFAEPSVIAEQYYPDREIYVTTLKTQLNKPGFCKYSASISNFANMEGLFPGYDIAPKESLGADVNVTEKKTHDYWIVCKGKNQLLSKPEKVSFTIDLAQKLNVSSSTPQGFATTNFTIGVVANKRVFCYFGEQEDDTTKCMGACTSSYTQSQKITVSAPGPYTYFVKCAHVTGEQSDVIEIPVIIDTSPPTMDYVKDDGSITEDPAITWSQSKIRVAVNAKDEESGISHYLITLKGQTDNKIEFKDYVSDITNGEYFYIRLKPNGEPFRLRNDNSYKFVVKAVNRVGLESEIMESDGVRVDTSQEPGPCGDGELSQNETDMDCGGECDGCPENRKCGIDGDCATNYCQDKLCKVASCEDGYKNGLESDVDCGGQTCNQCEKDMRCIQHADCKTEYCDIQQEICVDAPPCADKLLTTGETDIDCGGPCEKCKEDQNCAEKTDCSEELYCTPDTKKCSSEIPGDEDHDGILDDIDDCFGTPADETPDEKGCGPSQTFTLGDDINDRWRMDHFKCIDCPEAATDADPDKDGLTNLQEFTQGTNPTKKDTDGDGWKDGVELDKGTSPTDPASHPPSIFLGFLWTIFILLLIAGAGYGIYIVLQARKEKKKPAIAEKYAIERPPAKITAAEEIAKLKEFAKEEEIPEKDWISLEKVIKKKPLPPKKFAEAIEQLRKIAHKERAKPEQPLMRLRAMLDEIGEDEKIELLARWKMLKAGLLTKAEIEELLRRLKITAQYYHAHKEELDQELAHYGRRKKH